ncbi:GntT/GntP/DsdX family permease [Helicobacter vulpis]|uniref:GntT/GntP/DsdX family permease n=1 Tax=Helicobacter vulpis TaxID=2316076 RepID=UPI000EAC8ABF|nr:TRAP transporter large permease subunit [Helicobacter vulpis]
MLGILLGLGVLMVLAYLGWSIVWVAPIAAGVVAICGGLDWLNTYTHTYMGGFCAFAKVWFPIFMLGAIFGKLMEMSGMASAIAKLIAQTLGQKRAILGVVLACAAPTTTQPTPKATSLKATMPFKQKLSAAVKLPNYFVIYWWLAPYGGDS